MPPPPTATNVRMWSEKVENTRAYTDRSEFIFWAKVYYRGFLPKVSGMSPLLKNEKKRGGTASYSPPNSVSSSVLLKARGNLLRLFVFSLLLFSQQSPIFFVAPPLLLCCRGGILRDTESSFTLSHFWEKRVLVVRTRPAASFITPLPLFNYHGPPFFRSILAHLAPGGPEEKVGRGTG